MTDYIPQSVQVRKPILGEFIEAVVTKHNEGYTFSKYEAYRLGADYILDMRLPTEKVVTEVTETPEVVPTEPEVEAPVSELADTAIPDWKHLDALVLASDKDALELYMRDFGFEANKRKSAGNIMKAFKLHVGA